MSAGRARCWLRCADPRLQYIRGQLSEIGEVERVNALSRAGGGATQEERIVDFWTGPATAGSRIEGFDIVISSQGHELEMREYVGGDDMRRFGWMDAGLDRQTGKRSIEFSDGVKINKTLVFSGDYTVECGFGAGVMRVTSFGSGNQNRGIEENPHWFNTISKPIVCVPLEPDRQGGPNWRRLLARLDGPKRHLS